MTAPRKPATATSSVSSSSKMALALGCACLAAAGFALWPKGASETVSSSSEAPGNQTSAARHSSTGRSDSLTGTPGVFSPDGSRVANSTAPPEAATRTRVRSSPSSSSATEPLAAAGSSVTAPPLTPAESHEAAIAARVALNATMPPLPYKITPEQAQQIAPNVPPHVMANLRSQFDQTSGSSELDPAEPEYSSRWDAAQREAADQMRALYGWAAYAGFQRQAALAATGQKN